MPRFPTQGRSHRLPRVAWGRNLRRAEPVKVTESWAGLRPGPLVMGILNVTPDSFSDGSLDPQRVIAAGFAMAAQGVDIIDVGGESTRPGASPVAPELEQSRVLPVIAGLRGAEVPISIDTRNASTMRMALDAGATIVNDVSALSHDPRSLALVAGRGCPVVLMHMRGTPQTMAGLAEYRDVVGEVVDELSIQVELAVAAGVARERIAVDPGFGFAKDSQQNMALLRGLRGLATIGLPIVIGLSRKRFLSRPADVAKPSQRDTQSLAAALFAVSQGATVVRVHDVEPTVRALRLWQALSG